MPETNARKRLVKSDTVSALFGGSKSAASLVAKDPLQSAKNITAQGDKSVNMALRRFHDEIIIKKFLNTEENAAFLFKLLGAYPHFLGKTGISKKEHQISIEVIGLLRGELDKIAKGFLIYRGMIKSSKVFKASSSILAGKPCEEKESGDELSAISAYLRMIQNMLLSNPRFYISIRNSLVMLEFYQSHGIKANKEKKEEGRPISAFRETVFPLIKAVSKHPGVKDEFVLGMNGVFEQFCASRNTRVIKTAGSLNPENSIDIPIGDIPFFLSHILLAMEEARRGLDKAKLKYTQAKVVERDKVTQALLLEKIQGIDGIISQIDTVHGMLKLQNLNINNCAKHSSIKDVQEELDKVPLKAVSLERSSSSVEKVARLKDRLSMEVVTSNRKSVIIERTNQVVSNLDRQARHKNLIAEQARTLLHHARSKELEAAELNDQVGDAADIALIPQLGHLIDSRDRTIADLELQVNLLTEMQALKKVQPCRFSSGEKVVSVASISLPFLAAGFGYALAEKAIEISVIAGLVGSTPPGLLVLLGFAIGCLFTLMIKNYLLKRSQKRANDNIEKRSTFMSDNPVFCAPEKIERAPLLANMTVTPEGGMRI